MRTATVKFLVTAALRAPSADNSQPWHLTWDGDYLTLTYDADRVSGLTFQADDPATLFSMGGIIENLIQAADHIDARILYEDIQESELKSGTYLKIKPLQKEHTRLPENYDDLPLFHRHTNRFPYKNNALHDELLASIATETELNAHASVITLPEKIRSIGNLVTDASEIRFQTREVHEWLGKSLRFNVAGTEYGDGLDVETFDLPPGGGMFLKFISNWDRMVFFNRFRLFKLLSMIESAPVKKAPALVAITCPADAEQVVAAGRLCTRIWSRLNAEGVAAHPYYVITDQLHRLKQNRIPDNLKAQARKLEDEVNRIFDLNEDSASLQMLLRIGYPKTTPVRSKRLQQEAVFSDVSKKQGGN